VTAEIATTQELLQRIGATYDELKAAVSAFSDDDTTKPNVIGDWSVRDVVAHIGGDEMWMAGQLEALRSEMLPSALSCYGIDQPPPPNMDWSQDGRNAWQRERLKDLSLDDTRAMAREAHRRLLTVIAAFRDQDLMMPLAIAELNTVAWIRPPEQGEQTFPLWQWIRGVTYQHYAEHSHDIRNAASTKGA
jgi:hypothetical protein